MKYTIINLLLSLLAVSCDKHFEIHTDDCSVAYQDHEGLIWSINKDQHEELNSSNVNVFQVKGGRPVRVYKHSKIDGKLVIKPHCHQDSVEITSRLDKHVAVCKGEEGNHGKCHCDPLAPGDSITHRGDDSIRINDHHETECTGKGLFPLLK